jgi:hypothetical protein
MLNVYITTFFIGIKGLSELYKLKTILYPWSFPTDIMHLFFENVAPQMYAHWTGKFFKDNSTVCPRYNEPSI